jgi:hypothetical protein
MPTPIERTETEKDLAAAKECYFDGTIATIAQAAHEHGVKEGTQRNQLKGMRPRSERPVNNKRLNDAQELGLCLHVDKMEDIGFHLRLEAIEASANLILSRAHNDPDKPVEPVGETWVTWFLKCYPEYEKRV